MHKLCRWFVLRSDFTGSSCPGAGPVARWTRHGAVRHCFGLPATLAYNHWSNECRKHNTSPPPLNIRIARVESSRSPVGTPANSTFSPSGQLHIATHHNFTPIVKDKNLVPAWANNGVDPLQQSGYYMYQIQYHSIPVRPTHTVFFILKINTDFSQTALIGLSL